MKERFQKPTTLATEIARHLREAIIKGELAPGERVNESKLTRDLGLSRSPVREAIRILESEGLLTLEPHRGAHVRPLGDDDLQEIFDVRLMIESHGLRRDPTGSPPRSSPRCEWPWRRLARRWRRTPSRRGITPHCGFTTAWSRSPTTVSSRDSTKS